MNNPLAQMLWMELRWRLMKNKWTLSGYYLFPVTIWMMSDAADEGKWGYKK
jgi:hypothetical protein